MLCFITLRMTHIDFDVTELTEIGHVIITLSWKSTQRRLANNVKQDELLLMCTENWLEK